jgi:threonine dehydrogenase-like Zn-dependent dehydrogenase
MTTGYLGRFSQSKTLAEWDTVNFTSFECQQPSPNRFIMGHEFTGIVKETRDQVKSVKIGDKIVSPFTVAWLVFSFPIPLGRTFWQAKLWHSFDCFYCKNGYFSRCDKWHFFSSAVLDGAQAECLWLMVPS